MSSVGGQIDFLGAFKLNKMIEIILTLAGEFRGIKNFSCKIDTFTGESVYEFEGYLGTGTSRIWEIPISQVIAKGYKPVASPSKITEPTPGKKEYFVFGKCTGLALDGSTGIGPYTTEQAFFEYVE